MPEPTPHCLRCAICQSAIAGDETRAQCPSCGAEYHLECWDELGGCATYGCPRVPAIEPLSSTDIPAAYWGQEHKACPACGREILAAAVRCRHCGATFASAQPEDTAEFQERAARRQRLPRAQRAVIVLFVLSVIPCLAPLGGIAGLVWRAWNRRDLESLPAIYPALSKIGLAVAFLQTAVMILMVILYQHVYRGAGP
ncbi:MAG: hypothetical protein KJ072_07780 [Verrucomicrobia bacterium]|nr:hypothetical protein [Verrucomicrobiota bacterium]